ncbi:GroES-like protein [Paraphaeosphaeria sporulosa]|uniref:GroES-like protein n=1 Tax=Paraphaeosphaeria sporulosa TaxID=1460663 RepID=A0A177CCP4_9PLEO|nr:GroES-like protein [Paraphaeosphaeria sporulosa]OAG04548.1 GroES-like protein [Paraphaeosphaeria sporulosa]
MSPQTLPHTYRAYRKTSGPFPRTIELFSAPLLQQLAPRDVLIRVRAVALNYRDIAMLNGRYPTDHENAGLPCSDCAGEVAAIGSSVQGFQIGDRVSPCFNMDDLDGKQRDEEVRTLGGSVMGQGAGPGVLGEYVIFSEDVLVRVPKYLTWEEASTLPCAGVTAWTALGRPRDVQPDTTMLLQGTGGVSSFALFLCIAANITPIITSSSDAKLLQLASLSPLVKTFNYKTHPDQISQVKHLTDGKGVDVVINNTGVASLIADLESLRSRHGMVSMVGMLDNQKAEWEPSALMLVTRKLATIQGTRVGSKKDFQELNAFLEEKEVDLNSLIDRTFKFDQAKEAFEYLESGNHVGKVVIKI